MSTSSELPLDRPSIPNPQSQTPNPRPLPGRALLICFALAIFVGAFLVFQVQPVISKTILPWFGGSPAVWTTCMLFFQIVLFAGYVYAHVLSTRLRPAWQGAVHVLVLAGALALLPIEPDASWKPIDSASPTWRIMLLLAANVGLPYFLLSTTGPLLQSWFARSFPGRSPYRLYALSNVGSFLALLSYPILFEPNLTTHGQAIAWSLGFCAFAVLCGFLATRLIGSGNGAREIACADLTSRETTSVTGGSRLAWLLLPAFASVMLLATTNHVCQDVAVIPFLWVIPLSLYLLSFIICFDSPRWYHRGLFGSLTAVAVLAASAMTWGKVTEHLILETGVYFAALFGICMVCHGELYRLRPKAERLTEFYLLCSAGGALGGVFVAILCPLVFSTFAEMYIGLVVSYAIGLVVAGLSWTGWRSGWGQSFAIAAVAGLLFVVGVQFRGLAPGRLAAMRNFYGVLYVDDVVRSDATTPDRVLFHGRIAHGYQFTAPDKRREPTMYFDRTSGVGKALENFPRTGQRNNGKLRVGVIGLGAGTVATYGQPGDYYRFYEINPQVEDAARQYFTFLSDSPAKVEVILGDARLSMEREPNQDFDVLVLDAFSGDAIPAHLLTTEAFDIYRRHLRPGGVIAAHISNRHVDLTPVLANVAQAQGYPTAEIKTRTDADRRVTMSQWILLTNNQQFLAQDAIRPAHAPLGPFAHVRLWTDQYSNLIQLLK